ncbi:unnamed protein product [Cyprideis torosa]|uniref:Uncharacterized protein n=1 Tax=Cyprideis torosa TaxID=163714 RepID=A0A7R8W3M5_9CRUS|nr:unnamed protein product [Cyprideis torosa]CAG0879055.1 unnamed protein product [Cyprideis torosa]
MWNPRSVSAFVFLALLLDLCCPLMLHRQDFDSHHTISFQTYPDNQDAYLAGLYGKPEVDLKEINNPADDELLIRSKRATFKGKFFPNSKGGVPTTASLTTTFSEAEPKEEPKETTTPAPGDPQDSLVEQLLNILQDAVADGELNRGALEETMLKLKFSEITIHRVMTEPTIAGVVELVRDYLAKDPEEEEEKLYCGPNWDEIYNDASDNVKNGLIAGDSFEEIRDSLLDIPLSDLTLDMIMEQKDILGVVEVLADQLVQHESYCQKLKQEAANEAAKQESALAQETPKQESTTTIATPAMPPENEETETEKRSSADAEEEQFKKESHQKNKFQNFPIQDKPSSVLYQNERPSEVEESVLRIRKKRYELFLDELMIDLRNPAKEIDLDSYLLQSRLRKLDFPHEEAEEILRHSSSLTNLISFIKAKILELQEKIEEAEEFAKIRAQYLFPLLSSAKFSPDEIADILGPDSLPGNVMTQLNIQSTSQVQTGRLPGPSQSQGNLDMYQLQGQYERTHDPGTNLAPIFSELKAIKQKLEGLMDNSPPRGAVPYVPTFMRSEDGHRREKLKLFSFSLLREAETPPSMTGFDKDLMEKIMISLRFPENEIQAVLSQPSLIDVIAYLENANQYAKFRRTQTHSQYHRLHMSPEMFGFAPPIRRLPVVPKPLPYLRRVHASRRPESFAVESDAIGHHVIAYSAQSSEIGFHSAETTQRNGEAEEDLGTGPCTSLAKRPSPAYGVLPSEPTQPSSAASTGLSGPTESSSSVDEKAALLEQPTEAKTQQDGDDLKELFGNDEDAENRHRVKPHWTIFNYTNAIVGSGIIVCLPGVLVVPMADTSPEEIPLQYRRYPITGLLVVMNIFFEMLQNYGTNTLLLYFMHKLHFPEQDATSLVHGLAVAGAVTAVIGFYFSENILGRFYNTLIFSVVQIFGRTLMMLASFDMSWFPMWSMTWVAEAFIILSGCRVVSRLALGADQYKFPEQKRMRSEYFLLYYFVSNIGSVFSNIYFPELRVLNCGMVECFPFVFGVALILSVLGTMTLVVGWFHFHRPEIKGGVTFKAIRCAFSAAKNRLLGPRQDLEHWAEYADHSTYDEDIRNDTSQMSRALWMYLPLPLYFSLYRQTESTWVSQALLMTGKFGDSSGLKADQVFSFNPFLVLIFIPLFSFALYPLLKKVGIERPLAKMVLGLSLISLAFFMTAGLQFIINSKVPPLPEAGQGAVCFGNVRKEAITLSAADCSISEVTIEPGGHACIRELNVEREKECHLTSTPPITGTFKLFEKETTTVFLAQTVFQSETQHADPEKEDSGFPKFRFYFDLAPSVKGPLILRISEADDIKIDLPDPKTFTSYEKNIQENQNITLLIGDLKGNFTGGPGGVYDIFITNGIEKGKLGVFPVIVTEENSVHRLWQLPQLIILTIGEVMFAVTRVEFNYTESPHSMRTLLAAVESVCSALGNLLIIILKQMNLFDSMAFDFIFFAILMALADLFLLYMSCGYVYLDDRMPEEERLRRHSSVTEAKSKLRRDASEDGKTSLDALVPRKSKTV